MTLHVLLVEDDADLRHEIQEYLKRRSYGVTAVGSSAEARDFLAAPSAHGVVIDVVLCDINLGDGSGINLYLEFASLRPACHWVLMSGAPDLEYLLAEKQRVAGLPPFTVAAKPVSLRNLATLVSGHRFSG